MSKHQIVLFEDTSSRGKLFKPLTYTRPFAELLTGAFTAIERTLAFFGSEIPIVLHVRQELAPLMKKRYPNFTINDLPQAEKTIFINSRLLISDYLFGQVQSNDNTVFLWDDHPGDILAFTCNEIPKEISKRISSGEPIASDEIKLTEKNIVKAKLFSSLWNIVNSNPVVIQNDIKKIVASKTREFNININQDRNADVTEFKEVHVSTKAKLTRRTFLNATEGPILIEDGVTIEPNAIILGPAVIRKGSLIKAGAKIHPGTTIGPVSKVGGEIENSIVQGYSNKQHDGYLGHSYIGEWCNLGAGTNTSDLKNDYSNVKVTIEGEEFETKSLFVGLLMGDHSKSAIGTQFNTGTAVGVSSNIFCPGFPPKWIPNFSWCGPDGLEKYKQEKAMEVAKIVMARRKKEMSEEEESLLKSLT